MSFKHATALSGLVYAPYVKVDVSKALSRHLCLCAVMLFLTGYRYASKVDGPHD
jgi:hypothetical protein